MLNDFKKIIKDLNDILEEFESTENEVSLSIKNFEKNRNLIKNINEIKLENKNFPTVNDKLILTSLKFNKDKITKIEKYIKLAKQNLFKITEIHSMLFQIEEHDKFILAKIDLDAKDLEKEVLKLVSPLSLKKDKEIAEYIRNSLSYIKKTLEEKY